MHAVNATDLYLLTASTCNGLVVEYWNHSHGAVRSNEPMTYCVLRPTQPPTPTRMGSE